jgi:nitrogen fixation protein NifU and related proteins
MDLKELYQDIILEHGKSPRNFGKCNGHNHEAKGYNPLCGDQVQVYLKLNDNKRVENLTFEGSGCAISMASTSIMTELIKGKSSLSAKKIINAFLNMIKSGSELKTNDLNEDQKIKIMSLSGVKQYPMRVRCATLAWHTLISAIDGKKVEINTEVIDK